jgi:hypothetical protein
LFFASKVKKDSRNPKSNGRNSKNESEQRYGISGRLLPKGFALFCLSASLFSGFLTFLLLYLSGL